MDITALTDSLFLLTELEVTKLVGSIILFAGIAAVGTAFVLTRNRSGAKKRNRR